MGKRDVFKLTLPNDISYLSVAQASVREAATMYGFSGEDIYKIELGLEEAFMNVVQHAFDAGERSSFDIICERLPVGIKIIVKEKGIPFDPSLLPSFNRTDRIDEIGAKGLGTFLMKEILDEVSFHNLGPEGKETHLVKHLKNKKIENSFALSGELESNETAASMPAAISEKIEYDVRRMKPSEAIEVSKGAYKSHGYTFFDEHIYYPDQIIALNESGEMISVVAVTKDQAFMGHAALHYPYEGAPIAELTYIFVNPEYRSQGCMGRMLDLLFATPKIFDVAGIYAFAVANHIFSQKTVLKHGLNDCGIELATSPATWVFKGIADEESQRISVVLSFRYLKKPEPMTLYPPLRHKEMIERLYGHLGANHALSVPYDLSAQPKDERSVIETRVYATEGNAEIIIVRYGSNILRETKGILRDLCVRQVAAINLFLSLEDPLTYTLASEFEKMDFFFAGILPKTQIGDALILQYLNNIAFDYGKVVAHSQMAKEILAYIRQCDPYASLTP